MPCIKNRVPSNSFLRERQLHFQKEQLILILLIPLIGATSRLLRGSLIKLNVNNCITEIDWLRHR